jgi:hypothetical protein
MTERVTYDDSGALDEVVVHDVATFHLEYLDDNCVWMRCTRKEGDPRPDIVVKLSARGKIKGMAEED